MNEPQIEQARILPIVEGTSRPLWSVMIPTYNCASYLRQTLESVLSQDPGPDWMQIEVIDDHSTCDDPQAVVKELGQGRVNFYQQPQNVGYIRNFETCLQRSRGHLVHQLHGDDYVRDGFYRKMQALFEQNARLGAAFCRSITMDQQGNWQTLSRLEQPTSGILTNWLEQIASEQRITTPSIVVRRSVYEHLGGFDRRIVCCGEDWEMWVRIASHYQFAYEPEPLAVYRFKPLESLAASRIHQIMQDMRMATEIVRSYLPKHLPPEVADQLLSQARESYAFWSLEVARKMLLKGNTGVGMALLKESLESSYSPKVIARVGRLLLKAGLYQVRQRLGLAMNPS